MRAISSIRSASQPISKRQLGAVQRQTPSSAPDSMSKPRPVKIRSTSSAAISIPSIFLMASVRKGTGSRTGKSAGADTSTTGPASPPTHSSSKAVARSIARYASSGSTPRSYRCDASVCNPYCRARPDINSGVKNAASRKRCCVLALIPLPSPPIIPASASAF